MISKDLKEVLLGDVETTLDFLSSLKNNQDINTRDYNVAVDRLNSLKQELSVIL